MTAEFRHGMSWDKTEIDGESAMGEENDGVMPMPSDWPIHFVR